jgi:hypothetical protein
MFDWNDPAIWPSALDGVGSVYLSYYPDLAVPGAVEAVLGREPRDFSDYARRRTAATGVWNGSAAAALSRETMDGFLFALTLVTALGCGLNAGVFFAFSSFVVKALPRLQPAQGIAAMQSINLVAVTPRS